VAGTLGGQPQARHPGTAAHAPLQLRLGQNEASKDPFLGTKSPSEQVRVAGMETTIW
jgi:hypothetical protein